MKALSRFLSGSLFCWLAVGIGARAEMLSPQGAAPAQNAPAAQGAPQTRGRDSERRPAVFGKLTAVHDQSVEITVESGDIVTVKISGSTQFRKDGQDAKPSDFKVGDIVFVRGKENADHTWNAELMGTRSNGGFGGGRGPGGGRPAGVLGQDYVFGEVKSLDAPKLTILRPDNVTQTVELNEDTSLRKGRDSITMAEIQPGDHIMVRGGMTNNVFQPKSVMVIGPEQWKRMQEMGMAGGGRPRIRRKTIIRRRNRRSRHIEIFCSDFCFPGSGGRLACHLCTGKKTPGPARRSAAAPAANALPLPQATYQITGSVHSGKTPLPGVALTASNTLTGKKYATATISDGTFVLPGLPRGRYVLRAEFMGFAAAHAGSGTESLKIPSGKADFELILASRQQEQTNQRAAAAA